MESGITRSEGPIGVFDSGYGGLTILNKIQKLLPDYDYLYLGDNARAPYGTRSFEIVYQFTLQAVRFLFEAGCPLVILACNTASAKALRTIQQVNLPSIDSSRRVLGVIRPTVEAVGEMSANGNIGLVATQGTISSRSYEIEIAKLYPEFNITGKACSMWVSLVENQETDNHGAQFFIKRDLEDLLKLAPNIDTLILGCTHFPIIRKEIEKHLPSRIKILEQGEIVAKSLKDYLSRHPEIDERCTKGGSTTYLTTEEKHRFDVNASYFLNKEIDSRQVTLQ